ncbi:diaminopimelate epimerase [Vulgatibacter incomptus]|uniref:Diaminopimelate epimerase n=1 Tax=Vulgatibacter incomptus TaxID=1391653 RepID=A0A0K1PD80_9BACT|nr:diaminopimelate epimerase [Vulgatibacter incomptus]AKU91457.1 Diaminopimelate epimerase [Vulgatibacter incomptus]
MNRSTFEFVKLQGLGNDYVFIDCLDRPLPPDPSDLARRVSDRHFGVGSDGLIAVLPGERASLRMRMWNADGSEGEMCGNGLRGFAKYVFERGYVGDHAFDVETKAGVLRPEVLVEDGRVARVRVDMGRPRFERGSLPMAGAPDAPCIDETLSLGGAEVQVTCVSMGNPHCILFVDDVATAPVTTLGPAIEIDPTFPRRVNVSFVAARGPRELHMRVWERGSGETLACGTGACAAAVAAALTGRAERSVVVHLPGGPLEIEWSDHVLMTGPTVEVFRGVFFDPK